MTGHLNGGSGPPDGNTFLRNEQIRQYCMQNNKILFDFADIESWDPDGNDHRDDDDSCTGVLIGVTLIPIPLATVVHIPTVLTAIKKARLFGG